MSVLEIRFICSAMWQPYLDVIAERAQGALNVLDRCHIAAERSEPPVRNGSWASARIRWRTPSPSWRWPAAGLPLAIAWGCRAKIQQVRSGLIDEAVAPAPWAFAAVT